MASIWGSLRNFLGPRVGVNGCNGESEGEINGSLYGMINEHTSTLCDRLIATGPGWVCRSERKLLVKLLDINVFQIKPDSSICL